MSDGIEHETSYAAGVGVAGTVAGAVAVGGTGVGTPAGSLVSQPSRTPTKRGNARKRTNGATSTGHSAPSDPSARSITITLPKDVVEWYEQQAARAPFEPSVQRYMAWQLRQQMAAEQAAAALGQPAATTTPESTNPLVNSDDPTKSVNQFIR